MPRIMSRSDITWKGSSKKNQSTPNFSTHKTRLGSNCDDNHATVNRSSSISRHPSLFHLSSSPSHIQIRDEMIGITKKNKNIRPVVQHVRNKAAIHPITKSHSGKQNSQTKLFSDDSSSVNISHNNNFQLSIKYRPSDTYQNALHKQSHFNSSVSRTNQFHKQELDEWGQFVDVSELDHHQIYGRFLVSPHHNRSIHTKHNRYRLVR